MNIKKIVASEEDLTKFLNNPPVNACGDLILTLCFSIQNPKLLNKLGDFRCNKLILKLFDSDTNEERALGEGCDKAFAKLFSAQSSHYKTFILSWQRDEFPIEIARAIDQTLSTAKEVIQDVTLELLVSHVTLLNEKLIKQYELSDFRCVWLPTDSKEKDKEHVGNLVNLMSQLLKSGSYSEKFELSFEDLNLTVEQGKTLINSIVHTNSRLTLNFSSNQIGNELLIALGERLKELGGLSSLRIKANKCGITNAGLISLIEMLPENCPQLQIELKDNAISDKGFASLFEKKRKLPNNFILDLSSNRLSAKVLDFLTDILNDRQRYYPNIKLYIGKNERMLPVYSAVEELVPALYNSLIFAILNRFGRIYKEPEAQGIKIMPGIRLAEQIELANFNALRAAQNEVDQLRDCLDLFNGSDNDLQDDDKPPAKHVRLS